jgi:hypothetical protein
LRPAPPLPELELVVVVLGVVVPPAVPPPVGLAPPDAEAPDEDEPPEPAAVPPEELEPLEEAPEDEEPVAAVLDVAVVGVVELPAEAAAVVEPPDGIVSGGAPLVSTAAVVEPPLPQADRPTDSVTPAASATIAAGTG